MSIHRQSPNREDKESSAYDERTPSVTSPYTESEQSSTYRSITSREGDNDSEGSSSDGGEASGAEELLMFTSFPMNGLRGHRIMALRVLSDACIAIGTNQGTVALVDMAGNIFRTVQLHSDPISDMTCDVAMDFIGSSDKAGYIAVQNLGNPTDVWRRQLDVSIVSIALHPQYSRADGLSLMCAGGDKVLLMTKAMFLPQRKCTVLYQGKGKVYLIRWCGDVAAWATDGGITLYSYSEKSVLKHVPRPQSTPRAELYRCHLFWENTETLLCGWGDWIVEIHVGQGSESSHRSNWGSFQRAPLPDVYIHAENRTSAVESAYRVGGLAPFGPNRFLVLACIMESEGHMKSLEVRVVTRETLHDVYRGRLLVTYMHPLQLSLGFSYGLQGHINEPMSSWGTVDESVDFPPATAVYYILSADSILQAHPRDCDDHVDFLLSSKRYADAYTYSTSHAVKRHTPRDLGHQCLACCMAACEYAEVVALLPVVAADDRSVWEQYIYELDQVGESWRLVDVLPSSSTATGDHLIPSDHNIPPQALVPSSPSTSCSQLAIGRSYYVVVLLRCLEKDVVLFRESLRRFAQDIDASVVFKAVERRHHEMQVDGKSGTCTTEEKVALAEAYAMLLELQGRDEEALQILLALEKSDELFRLIQEKKLLEAASGVLPELFERNGAQTLRLLMEHASVGQSTPSVSEGVVGSQNRDVRIADASDPLSPERVVQRLKACERSLLWQYIRELRQRHPSVFFMIAKRNAPLLATLFIEYEPSSLVAFLREMSMYMDRMKDILALCRKNNLLDGVVLLLSRMGKEEEGLRVLVQQMKNLPKAVQYITESPSTHDHAALFKKLVQFTVEANNHLLGEPGKRYFMHKLQAGDTYESIARLYGVDVGALQAANYHSSQTDINHPEHDEHAPARLSGDSNANIPSPCKVPVHLLESLLAAASDPRYAEDPAIDAHYLLTSLPKEEPIPHAGACIAALARSRGDEHAFLSAVASVTEQDLSSYYVKLFKSGAAAVRVASDALCGHCQQSIYTPQQEVTGTIVFTCGHTFHAQCTLGYKKSDSNFHTSTAEEECGLPQENSRRRGLCSGQQKGLKCRLCC